MGYGVPDVTRVSQCSSERVTLLAYGRLTADEADEFAVPLPPSLSGESAWRRLTITLGWMSPINSQHRKYRRAQLWFEPPRAPLSLDRVEADWQGVTRGTLQHEILEGDRANLYADGAALTFRVNCRSDAGVLDDAVPYGLVLSLEVAPGIAVPIYDEVAARIRTAVRITPTP
jgi:hypothetical protein